MASARRLSGASIVRPVDGNGPSVEIETSLLVAASEKAMREGTTLSEVVTDFLQAWVEERPSLFQLTDEPGAYDVAGREWWARTFVMTVPELIGEILAMAQIIEEIMRVFIAASGEEITSPRQIGGTFGVLKGRFRELFPDETELLASLDAANEIRNDAAHSDLLVATWFGSILQDQDPESVDYFIRKGLRSSLYAMRTSLLETLNFLSRHHLEDPYPSVPSEMDSEG